MSTQSYDPAQAARRAFLRTGPAAAAALALAPAASHASPGPLEAWFATWGAAPAGPPASSGMLALCNQTLRLIVHASAGGSRVRVRLSNEMGATPLRIGAAGIGLRSGGASLVAGSARGLLFSNRASAVIPPGAALLSDPVDLDFPAFADLAISLYLPDNVQATTTHDMAQTYCYVSSAGNFATAPALPVQSTIQSWPFLAEVDVAANAAGADSGGASVVALGDSITDGARSSGNLNRRWPDYLAQRLQWARPAGSMPIGVVNRGICGNCMLTEYASALIAGHSAAARFDRDVLATAGVRWLALLIGINDIVYSPAFSPIPAADMTVGYLQLVARARTRGIAVLGATLTPFEGLSYYLPAREAVRSQVNDWIRNSGSFDAVADFDLALRDPNQPTRLNPAYDSGDHLHPNDAGYAALAQAVPLSFFST
ncbi:SGNH/GDSL hydrolase family protein [Massilia sp. 9096]|uniref:SGNH/GDSL hydrolase family protein n=1 Tax=Massilia sp. 9096 TaxID=1500894 RepID=UPI0006892A60|nr:SGNH/GDSL hydrolase family protein [Massilia sp. 9096]